MYDFVTQDEIDDLPDDPENAFATLASHALRRVKAMRTATKWEEFRGQAYQFVRFIEAAMRQFDIDGLGLPIVDNIHTISLGDYNQALADLQAYITAANLRASLRTRRDSVSLSPEAKAKIRAQIAKIRNVIDRDERLLDGGKSKLHVKLTEFEAALEKSRLNFGILAGAAIVIVGTVASAATVADSQSVNKLFAGIWKEVAAAKEQEEQRKIPLLEYQVPILPSNNRQLLIEGPEEEEPSPDDEIPF